MKTQSRPIGVLERLMLGSDELLMGFAIIAAVGGCIVTIMAINERHEGMLLLAWLPVAVFFGVRLLRGRTRAAVLRERWESGWEQLRGPASET